MPESGFVCPSCGEPVGRNNTQPGGLVGTACKSCRTVITLKHVELWMKQAAIEKARSAIAERNKTED